MTTKLVNILHCYAMGMGIKGIGSAILPHHKNIRGHECFSKLTFKSIKSNENK